MERMRTTYLIDTHVFLWVLGGLKLSSNVKEFFLDRKNNHFILSDASAWEISIKYGTGKLDLPEAPETFVPSRVNRAGFSHLSIALKHVLAVHSLPFIHRDPFDRLLVAQARMEGLTLLSADPIFSNYSLKILNIADIS